MSKPFADNRIKLGVFLGERRKMLGAMRKLGSTAPASRADWSAPQPSTQGAVERCCMELVERNGDAERAMRAGLGLIEAMPTLATTVGTPLQVRAGTRNELSGTPSIQSDSMNKNLGRPASTKPHVDALAIEKRPALLKGVAIFAVLGLVAGCVAQNAAKLKAVGNERGGTVLYAGDMSSAMAAVRSHCEQFGKKGYITQMALPSEGGSLTFECH